MGPTPPTSPGNDGVISMDHEERAPEAGEAAIVDAWGSYDQSTQDMIPSGGESHDQRESVFTWSKYPYEDYRVPAEGDDTTTSRRPFRKQSKHWAITIKKLPKCFKEESLEVFLRKWMTYVDPGTRAGPLELESYIVAREPHASDKEGYDEDRPWHVHMYLRFDRLWEITNARRLDIDIGWTGPDGLTMRNTHPDGPPGFHPNIGKDPAKKSWRDYCLKGFKDGDPADYYFSSDITISRDAQNAAAWTKIRRLADAGDFTGAVDAMQSLDARTAILRRREVDYYCSKQAAAVELLTKSNRDYPPAFGIDDFVYNVGVDFDRHRHGSMRTFMENIIADAKRVASDHSFRPLARIIQGESRLGKTAMVRAWCHEMFGPDGYIYMHSSVVHAKIYEASEKELKRIRVVIYDDINQPRADKLAGSFANIPDAKSWLANSAGGSIEVVRKYRDPKYVQINAVHVICTNDDPWDGISNAAYAEYWKTNTIRAIVRNPLFVVTEGGTTAAEAE
jgi:hypothetical protein